MKPITFTCPKKVKMASGCESLELTEEGTWESFPPFAEKYTAQIGAKILKRVEAPDMHLWEIEYDGAILNFVYTDYPNRVSIEPKGKDGQAAVDKLFSLVVGQGGSNGL